MLSPALQVYAAIKQEVASGGRAYIVCPLVSDSDSDAMAGVRTVEEEYARLSGSGALHGANRATFHGNA
jgi:RecG-like helicase